MRVTWDDIERATIEGIFIVDGKSVFIGETAIDVWRIHPDAIFNTASAAGGADHNVDFVLRDFEIPPDDRNEPTETYLRSPASD